MNKLTRQLIFSCIILLSCSCKDNSNICISDFTHWWTFVDKLGTGSHIEPYEYFVTLEGDIEVLMTKSSDPEWTKYILPTDYPYVGIGTFFNLSKDPVDLSSVKNIYLVYKLNGPVNLVLSQLGEENDELFFADLPNTTDYNDLVIKWSDFYQPQWLTDISTLDKTKITGISFQITQKNKGHASLAIRSIILNKEE